MQNVKIARTAILYASLSMLSMLKEKVSDPAKEAGQSVRLIGMEIFEGEREEGAASVAVLRREGDESIFDKIEKTYPEMQVRSVSEDELEKFSGLRLRETEPELPEKKETVKDLREKLVALGGSVPANATIEQLRTLIAEREAAN